MYDPDPMLDLEFELSGRVWLCRTVFASGLRSAPVALEPERLHGLPHPLQPGCGLFRLPGDGTYVLVAGDLEVTHFCDVAKPPPHQDEVLDALFDPEVLGFLLLAAKLRPNTGLEYHLERLFTPSLVFQENPT